MCFIAGGGGGNDGGFLREGWGAVNDVFFARGGGEGAVNDVFFFFNGGISRFFSTRR